MKSSPKNENIIILPLLTLRQSRSNIIFSLPVRQNIFRQKKIASQEGLKFNMLLVASEDFEY